MQKTELLSKWWSEAERAVSRLGAVRDPETRERGPVVASVPLPCPVSSRLTPFQGWYDVSVRAVTGGLVTCS